MHLISTYKYLKQTFAVKLRNTSWSSPTREALDNWSLSVFVCSSLVSQLWHSLKYKGIDSGTSGSTGGWHVCTSSFHLVFKAWYRASFSAARASRSLQWNTNSQPCQKCSGRWQIATFSQFLAAYSTLDFTMSPLAGKGTWCLLPTTPFMLPTATKHFDRAEQQWFVIGILGSLFEALR